MPSNLPELSHRQFLMIFSAHQDSLVQHYRLHYLSFELAVFLCLLGMVLLPHFMQVISIPLLLVLHYKVRKKLRTGIYYRQQDVDWSQKQIMLAETELDPSHRSFTSFKIYQDRAPARLVEVTNQFLTNKKATVTEIDEYFFKHKSLSRGNAELMLKVSAWFADFIGIAYFGVALYTILFK